MAKFCTKCGAKLVDGKCPNCNNAQTNTITKTFDMDELITSIKGMFTHPIDTMKETIQTENITLGIILLVMNCIIIALFCCLGAKELIVAFTTGFNSFMVRTIEIPYARIFFTSLLSGLITYAIIAGLFYLVVNKLFHTDTNYKKMIAYLGITSIISSITLLGTIVLMYVSMQLMILFLLTGMLLSTVYMVQGLSYTSNIDKNKLGYVYAIVYFIVLVITIFILPVIFK